MTVSFRTEPWTISYCTINALKLAQTPFGCFRYILAKCLQIGVPILMLPSLPTVLESPWAGEWWNHDHSCPYPSITMDTPPATSTTGHLTSERPVLYTVHRLTIYIIQYFVGVWISSTNFSLQLSGRKSSIKIICPAVPQYYAQLKIFLYQFERRVRT